MRSPWRNVTYKMEKRRYTASLRERVESLVQTSLAVMYLDEWRSGTFLLYICKAAF